MPERIEPTAGDAFTRFATGAKGELVIRPTQAAGCGSLGALPAAPPSAGDPARSKQGNDGRSPIENGATPMGLLTHGPSGDGDSDPSTVRAGPGVRNRPGRLTLFERPQRLTSVRTLQSAFFR